MASDTDTVLAAANGLVEQARRMIVGQIEAVDDEAGQLERASVELNGTASSNPPTRPRPKATPTRKRPREYWEKKIIAELHKRPGTIRDLSKRLGLKPDSTTLFGPAKALLEQEPPQVEKQGAVYLLRAEKAKPKRRSRAAAKPGRAKAKRRSRAAASKPGGAKAKATR